MVFEPSGVWPYLEDQLSLALLQAEADSNAASPDSGPAAVVEAASLSLVDGGTRTMVVRNEPDEDEVGILVTCVLVTVTRNVDVEPNSSAGSTITVG